MNNIGLFIFGTLILITYLFFLCRMMWIKHRIQEKEKSNRKVDEKAEIYIIKFIMKNYLNIQNQMKKNKLPTKQKFILQISKILNNV